MTPTLSVKWRKFLQQTKRLLLDVDIKQMKEFQGRLLDFFKIEHKDVVDAINEKKVLDDEITEMIVEAVKEFKSR